MPEVLSAFHSDVVVFFDALDRLIQPEKFWSVVDQDFRALRGATGKRLIHSSDLGLF